jgi:hypothetical protein
MNLRTFLALFLAAVLAVSIVPSHPRAETGDQICDDPVRYPADQDFDQDGFLNVEECAGLIKSPPEVNLTVYGFLPGCSDCLDPAVPDLFVILNRASPSHIPANPFWHVSKPPADGGLGINVHVIEYSEALDLLQHGRMVIDRGGTSMSFQKAVQVNESPSASPIFGRVDAQWGTPNGLDTVWIWTNAIMDFIDDKCGNVPCIDDTTQARPTLPFDDSLYAVFIRNTLAHEIGHDIKLRKDYNSRFGGWHQSTKDMKMMSQSVDFRTRRTSVTWFTATHFDPPDPVDFVVWDQP